MQNADKSNGLRLENENCFFSRIIGYINVIILKYLAFSAFIMASKSIDICKLTSTFFFARKNNTMVKSYLRYYEERSLGSVASPYCPIAYSTVSSITTSDLVFSAALDTVAVWSLRQGKMIHNLFYKNFEQQQVQAFEAYDKPNINITQLAVSQDGKRVAVGYQDGRVCIFSQQQQQDKWALDLNSTSHTTAITSLVFSDDSALLASGSDDTDIVVWDVTSFSGLYRYVTRNFFNICILD